MIWIWLLVFIVFMIIFAMSLLCDFKILLIISLLWLFFIPILIFDVRNEKFNRPLKQNIEIKFKNGVAVDTVYTYE